MRIHLATASLCCGLVASTCVQARPAPTFSAEIRTDLRERGLGWSDGKAALIADAFVPVTYDLAVDTELATLRNSARHGGADVGVTLTPRYTTERAGWQLSVGGRYNAFIGRSGTSYIEGVADVSRTLGPVQATVGVAYAPIQGSIGGSNLYIDAVVSAGIPGTPLTISGGVGHTSGASRNDPRLARLRPGGRYLDHRVGVEYARNRVAGGLQYSGTSIEADEVDPFSRWTDRHFGSRLVAYLRVAP